MLAAREVKKLVLQDSIPEFLRQLALHLETKTKTTEELNQEAGARTCAGQAHGKVRAGSVGYVMQDVMHEYHILRQVIFQVLEEEGQLSGTERDVILDAIEKTKEDAATEFSNTLHDIKERFSLALTHDLKGPITVAKMMSELSLRHAHDPDFVEKSAIKVKDSMDRMSVMIQEILAAGRLRAGETLELNLREFDLTENVRNIVDEFSITDPGRVLFSQDKEIMGSWDADGLRRVLENLISNALKYGCPNSAVTVSLEESNGSAILKIHNLGNPISLEDQGVIFEQFRRVKMEMKNEGWGLGLMLAKGIVEAHGGTIQVQSSAELGTDFIVSLPIRDAVRMAS
ncbi:MAG: sensor histidine kinase [Bdellovibrionota bacterium]